MVGKGGFVMGRGAQNKKALELEFGTLWEWDGGPNQRVDSRERQTDKATMERNKQSPQNLTPRDAYACVFMRVLYY